MDVQRLGKRIKQARQDKNYSIKEVAEAILVKPASVRHYEGGYLAPSLKTLIAIANKLEIDADSLLCDSIYEDRYLLANEIEETIGSLSQYDEKDVGFLSDVLRETQKLI